MATVNVNPKQLEWARSLRHYSIAQAAGQIGIGQRELTSYERGRKKPTTRIFRKIAKVYGIPEATLFLNSPPSTADAHLKDFRTRTVGGMVSEISPETILIISRIRSYQARLSDIGEPTIPGADLPRLRLSSDAAAAGERERKRIGLTLREQLSWKGPDEAFRNWRKAIEVQGVCVFMEKFPISDCRGVSIFDDPKFPAILINKSEPAKEVAWIFSLIHEYAHVLLRKPGISDLNFSNRTEAYCNRFAAGFLMPLKYLKKVITPWPADVVDWTDDDIVQAARRLKVSQQSLALRLETLGVARTNFYESFRSRQSKANGTRRNGHPPPLRMRLHSLGRRFPTSIIRAMDSGDITRVDATQILNANTALLQKIRAELGV